MSACLSLSSPLPGIQHYMFSPSSHCSSLSVFSLKYIREVDSIVLERLRGSDLRLLLSFFYFIIQRETEWILRKQTEVLTSTEAVRSTYDVIMHNSIYGGKTYSHTKRCHFSPFILIKVGQKKTNMCTLQHTHICR